MVEHSINDHTHLSLVCLLDELQKQFICRAPFPGGRVSRIFLYLGYVLMTVTVINWAAASHDLEAIGRLTGDLGLLGLEAFGKPLLYTIFVLDDPDLLFFRGRRNQNFNF